VAQDEINEVEANAEVQSIVERAKDFVQQTKFEDVRTGQWFIQLLRQVVTSYQKNAKAEYFKQKYPGLSNDEIADKLISVTTKYAAIAGAITGVIVSANQLAMLASVGMTAPLFLTSIGVEMVCLAIIQIRLVLDLSVVYDLQLDADDPEDILMIFGYALGVAPTDIIGKGAQIAATETSKRAIKTFISKGTLKTIQEFARNLGFKILQRTIIKYVVPAVSAAVGSSYNYMTTASIGRIAKEHFKNREQASEELRHLISRQFTYSLIYPAAVRYIAEVDGVYSERENELYKSILARMKFDKDEQQELQSLLEEETNLLDAISQLGDADAAKVLMELLILMAVYDGALVEAEKLFLEKVAKILQLDVDMQAIELQANDYRVDYAHPVWRSITETTGNMLDATKDASQNFLRNATQNVQGGMQKLFGQKPNVATDTDTTAE
jgi:tellurite resistance protein